MEHALFLIISFILDLWWGDPRYFPHPVVGMGKLISWLDQRLVDWIKRMKWNLVDHVWRIRLIGLSFPVIIGGGVFVAAWIVVWIAEAIHPWFGIVTEALLIWTTIAPKGLSEAGWRIYDALKENDLSKARTALSMVVARDTEQLDEAEIVRGGVETVAENIVDAVVSPLFYAALGGAPLAMAYRAINTLDSMVGYKNERYLHLGWASARMDDLANFVPARITIIPMLLSFFVLRLHPLRALQTCWKDAKLHPSPNSGIPEALMAGALGIRLGGNNTYGGVVSKREYIGEEVVPKSAEHLLISVHVLWWTSIWTLVLFGGVCALFI